MAERVSSCVWRISDALVLAIDERLREPTDTYVNGSQVWLRDDGPGGEAIEWRLHPIAGYQKPAGVAHTDVLEVVGFALRAGDELPTPCSSLWDGLEAFPCYGDEVEPAPLAAAVTEVLGIAPDAFGVVDHDVIGDAWERAEGRLSIVDALLAQLSNG